MSKNNQRKAERAETTKIQFDSALKVYADNARSLNSVKEKMKKELEEVNAKYESQIQNLEQVHDAQFQVIKNFALANKSAFFTDKKKSITIGDVILGLRKDTPSLRPKEGFNWEAITKSLKEKHPELVKTVDEIKKSEIIAQRNSLSNVMGEFGLEIQQGERVYIELSGNKKPSKAKAPKETPVMTDEVAEEKV